MKKYISVLAAVLVIGSAGVATTSAYAGCSPGFIADVLCQTGVINQSTANTLDGVHAAIGAPLNQLNPLQGGGFQPQPMLQPTPPVRLGNVCVTNVGGYPGPFNPVGTPCQAMTPYGLAVGQVM
jgi:hypothetical protein